MLVANSTEIVFIPYLIVFYASSHPRNAMEPTAVLSPNKNAKSNPSPPEIDIWVPFFEESFKNGHFNRQEAQKIVN